MSGRCCLLPEWLCLLSAPGSAEVVGCSPCHNGVISVGCGWTGRDGRGQALLLVCTRCFCTLWRVVPGCQADSPSHADTGTCSPLVPGSPPPSLQPGSEWQRLPQLSGGKRAQNPATFCKPGRGIDGRARLSIPATGKAAAEGATWVLDIGECRGHRASGKHRSRRPKPFPAPLL